MSVSNYTPGNGCSYSYSKLRDRIYLVSEDHVKRIYIDNGEAYISGLTETPLVIEGFNIDFKEESSLDERYKFQKTLTISKKGYASFKDFQGKYYAIIETIDGTFYMINVDFPSKITHVFNLSKDTNQTDFTFTSLSNYPTLKINYDFGSVPYVCKGFNVSGIKGLKLCERIRTEISTVNDTVYTYGDTTGVNERSFRTIDYLGESCTFQEAYDGVNVTDTITFDIGFDAYKTSWQYNLLEFVENLYSAIIESKGEEDIRYYSGFNHGLEPSYSIAANNGDKQSDIITITLVEASNNGLFRVDEMTVTNDNSKSWRYIRKYGNHKTYECLEPGVGLYLVQEEVWANGTPTGRYKVMSGYEDEFYYLNIVGTFNDEVTFYQPECICGSRPTYDWQTLSIDDDYDCDSAATKYYKEAQVVSYDCGDTWEETGQYRRGNVYEYNSTDCGYEERWVNIPISEDYWCDDCSEQPIYRWVNLDPSTDYYCSGTTKMYKQQKQVSYDGGSTWENVVPAEYQQGAPAQTQSTDCGYVPPTPTYRWVNMDITTDWMCEGTTKYYKQKKQVSYDEGQTWQDVVPAEYQKGALYETESTDCGYIPPTPVFDGKWLATYSDSHTESAACDSSSAVTKNEVWKTNITSVEIGKCVSSIGESAFTSYSSLTSVKISDSVTDIGVQAFYHCRDLTTINIPSGITELKNGVFNDCVSLTGITIPNSVTKIGWLVFAVCNSLKRVNSDIDGVFNIPSSVTSLGVAAFSGCFCLTTVNIPNTITKLEQNLFSVCKALTGITIPSSVTTIGIGAFNACSGLTSIDIPSSVTSIGGWAFDMCYSLTSIDIPSSVTSIGERAFQYCSGLTSVTVNATTPPTLGEVAFNNTSSNLVIYVPASSVDAYKSASGWSSYSSRIQAIP